MINANEEILCLNTPIIFEMLFKFPIWLKYLDTEPPLITMRNTSCMLIVIFGEWYLQHTCRVVYVPFLSIVWNCCW